MERAWSRRVVRTVKTTPANKKPSAQTVDRRRKALAAAYLCNPKFVCTKIQSRRMVAVVPFIKSLFSLTFSPIRSFPPSLTINLIHPLQNPICWKEGLFVLLLSSIFFFFFLLLLFLFFFAHYLLFFSSTLLLFPIKTYYYIYIYPVVLFNKRK